MSRIYVIHENREWVEPLLEALRDRDLPFAAWFLDTGTVDLRVPPPDGVFYNRMSASSHTRGHRYAPEHAAAALAWLERHGRRVLNGGRALQLENTNYNSEAEAVAGQSGMGAIADYLGLELARLPGFTSRPASTMLSAVEEST